MRRQSERQFGLTFAALFAVLFAVGWVAFDARLDWAAVLAAVLLLIALAAPGVLLPFNRLWAALAGRLGALNNRLVLGLFFFLVMTPLAVALRLFRWDPMARRIAPEADSYWSPVGRNPDRDNLRDMF